MLTSPPSRSFDRTLQGLVDKVVPHLARQDEEAEAKFYKERGIKLKSEVAGVRAPHRRLDAAWLTPRASQHNKQPKSSAQKKLDPATTIHFRAVQAAPFVKPPRRYTHLR